MIKTNGNNLIVKKNIFSIMKKNTPGDELKGRTYASSAEQEPFHSIEEVFGTADLYADVIAGEQEELARPEIRENIKESLEEIRAGAKTFFNGITPETLPTTIEAFQSALVEAMAGGMVVGSLKVALALISESPAPHQLETLSKKTEPDDLVDGIFTSTDDTATEYAMNRDLIATPEFRRQMNKGLLEFKSAYTNYFNRMTTDDLPKTVEAFHKGLASAMSGGSALGCVKIALALIPEAPVRTS